MAKGTYTIATQEGVDRWGGQIGDTVEIDLAADQKKAVVAAGWVEFHEPDAKDAPADTKGGKK